MNMRKLWLNIDESLKCVSPNTKLFSQIVETVLESFEK